MKFGQTHVLRTAKGKLAVGVALILFGAVAVLAAPTGTDKLLCGAVVLIGAGLIGLGIRQDKAEKEQIRSSDKEAK